jgi:hypothetical protein
VVDLTAFCAVPLAALVVFWVDAGSGLLVGISGVEALAVVGLAWQVVWYAKAV